MFFYREELSALCPTPKLEDHLCQLFATTYSIYLHFQVSSITKHMLVAPTSFLHLYAHINFTVCGKIFTTFDNFGSYHSAEAATLEGQTELSRVLLSIQ
jgi:hypothetical protein